MVTGEIDRISTSKKTDHRVEASVGKSQWVVVISLPTNVNALAAKHTAEGIIGEENEVDLLLHIPL
jgi:elongation factor P--beta-lysine ligase